MVIKIAYVCYTMNYITKTEYVENLTYIKTESIELRNQINQMKEINIYIMWNINVV